MQFKYTAANPEGKRLTGVINAENEAKAREQLNALGFSILEIKEMAAAESAEAADLQKFEFEAIDKNGKKIKGTIPAKEITLAYARLIEEYSFNVTYIAAVNASPEEKTSLHAEGLQKLREDYLATGGELKKQEQAMAEVVESPEFLAEKQQLIEQVDQMITKVKQLLAQFMGKISPEKQAEINNIMDKLLRIKSSNNLDYIRHTSEELLQKIQTDEIFLQGQTHDKERQQIMLESQRMMSKMSKGKGPVDVGAQFQSALMSAEHKLEESKYAFLANPIKSFLKVTQGDPEVRAIKTQLFSLRTELWQALKMAIKSPKETRSANWAEVKKIREKQKELKAKIHTIKKLRHEQSKLIHRENRLYYAEEVSTFTGWLLFFYLSYYFLGHYVTVDGLGLRPLFGIPYDLGESAVFKYLLVFIFLLHAAVSLKLNFFFRSRAADTILATAVLLITLLTLFNF